MLGWVYCALGCVCTMFRWVPCHLLCCMTLKDLGWDPVMASTEVWLRSELSLKICLHPSPFLTPPPFFSLSCMFTHTFPLSFSIKISPHICKKPLAFLPLKFALTTSPTHHLSFCVSPSYILSLPLSPSLYCLNMQSYISSSSPIHGYLCVNHAPAFTSLCLCTPSHFNQISIFSAALVTLTACLAPASRPELKLKAVYFYIVSKIYAWISKGKQNFFFLSIWLFK